MRRAAILLLALAVPLAGCGRAGPPSPPGPKDRIIYPRAYPKPDLPPAADRLAPPDPSGMAPLGTTPGGAPNTPEVPPSLR